MPEYDEIAIRECVVNTLVHRQYTDVGSEVTVDIYDNRIVITSSGPMMSGLLFDKELPPEIPSKRRNTVLVDIFVRMNYMDRRGSRFDKMINGTNRLFKDNNNHVEFYTKEMHFSVVIYNANYKIGEISGDINIVKIIDLIRNEHNISQPEISKRVNISERT